MSKPYDSALNYLLDTRAVDWVAYFAHPFGIEPPSFQILDSDQSTTLQPDKLIRYDGDFPFILHLEFESSGGLGIPSRLM